jgi:hypothetical protein
MRTGQEHGPVELGVLFADDRGDDWQEFVATALRSAGRAPQRQCVTSQTTR